MYSLTTNRYCTCGPISPKQVAAMLRYDVAWALRISYLSVGNKVLKPQGKRRKKTK